MITDLQLIELGWKKLIERNDTPSQRLGFPGAEISRSDWIFDSKLFKHHITLIDGKKLYIWNSRHYPIVISEENLLEYKKLHNDIDRDPKLITHAEYLKALKIFKNFLKIIFNE